jgi:hypothetical protein
MSLLKWPKGKALICPNCSKPVARPNEGCVLHDLIQVLRERGEIPERRLRKLHADVDADGFWNDIARIIDRLQDGEYTWEEPVITRAKDCIHA